MASCFGRAPPNRWPRPPAAMIAVTCIGTNFDYTGPTRGPTSDEALMLLDTGCDDVADAPGEDPGVTNGRSVELRRMDGVVHDEKDVRRFGA